MLPHAVDIWELQLDVDSSADGVADLWNEEEIGQTQHTPDTELVIADASAFFVGDLGEDSVECRQSPAEEVNTEWVRLNAARPRRHPKLTDGGADHPHVL